MDADSIYEVPLILHDEGLDDSWSSILHLPDDRAGPDRVAGAGRPDPRRHRRRWTSPSSASTCTCSDAYLSVIEALRHAGFHHGARVEFTGSPRTSWSGRDRRGPGRRGRDPGARRVRRPGRGGQGRGDPLRPRARHPVPGAVPGPAVRGDRVRPERVRAPGRELLRVRPRDARPRDRPAARAGGRGGHGGHDAAGLLSGRPRAGDAGRTARTTSASSTSGTATGTR